MDDKRHDDPDAARRFEQVLGHELFYIKRKRARLKDRAAGGEYGDFHRFERLSTELAQARERDNLLIEWGRAGIEWGRAGIQQVGHLALKTKDLYEQLRGTGGPSAAAVPEPTTEDADPVERIERELKGVRRRLDVEGAKIYERAADENLTGLALSGGGIRSATFNLGVLQALAGLGCLKHLDYLSTVSGGGYIGGWLTALINRQHRQDRGLPAPGAESGSKPPAAAKVRGIQRVEERLRTANRPSGDPPEDPAIKFLRSYSNYLTPKTGVFSADTWSMVATYLRNVLLNLIILVAAIGAVVLLFRLLAAGFSADLGPGRGWIYPALPWIAFAAAGFAALTFGPNLGALLIANRGEASAPGDHRSDDQGHLLAWLVLPLCVGAVAIALWLPEAAAGRMPAPPLKAVNAWLAGNGEAWLWGTWLAVAHGASWASAFLIAYLWPSKPPQTGRTWGLLVLTAVISGFIGGLLLWPIAEALRFEGLGMKRAATVPLQLVFGPPLVLIWLYLLAVIQTGLMSRGLKDGHREWLSRLGAWLMICGLGWLAFFGIALLGPLLLERLDKYMRLALTSGWLLTTVGGLVASRGSVDSPGGASLLRRILINAAPYVFIVGFVAAVAAGFNAGVDWSVERFTDSKPPATETFSSGGGLIPTPPGASAAGDRNLKVVLVAYLERIDASQHGLTLLVWVAGLIFIALIQSRLIDINEFSMHRFYGNRLTRCYLGATAEDRHARVEPFTGFNRGDDLALAGCEVGRDDEREPDGGRLIIDRPGPFPIINTAINLVAGDDLAWQQRMAASFTMTPLYCGFTTSDASQDKEPTKPVCEFAYRPTRDFAGYPEELSLGVAMTTSGAAASPNMGYHTTPALSFLLTVFNVRLGRWVGNPRRPGTWRLSGPKSALMLLASEVFGLTRSDTDYVYLSDGGHFENLGIYELIRRRCRFIIACDAGADPEYKFEDLGNAIRKCRVDLGVDIRIGVDQIRERARAGFSRWHCAVGDIYYSDDDGGGTRGQLLYIKTSLTGDEPEDVINYAKDHDAFPHETTGDQFFDEAQFESYRRLGEHIGEEVLRCCKGEATDTFNIERAFVKLGHQWHPPLPQGERFTQLSKRIGTLFDQLRHDDELAFLDAQMYPEWRFLRDHGVAQTPAGEGADGGESSEAYVGALSLPRREADFRAGFYFCNSLIQLMEDVYLDLDLEDQWNHPDNRGWMNLFKHWSWVGTFRVTWAICAATYGQRFQQFCRQHLGLELGEIRVRGPHALELTKEHDRLNVFGDSDEAPNEESVERVLSALFGEGRAIKLNLLELSQILKYVHDGRYREDRRRYHLYQLELHVPRADDGEAAEPLFHFAFGYALTRGETDVELFRVQDHLRKMGLARGALVELMRKQPDLNIDALPTRFPDPDFSDRARRSFVNLFRSVQREHAAGQPESDPGAG